MRSGTLESLLARNIGRRIVLMIDVFPFFFIGRITCMRREVVVVEALQGIPIQFVGRHLRITIDCFVAFWIEDDEHPIPSLDDFATTLSCPPPFYVQGGVQECEPDPVQPTLETLLGRTLLLVLDPERIVILAQTTRPIFVAKLAAVHCDYVRLETVNIRFSSAPFFVFPLPLFVPIPQICVFTPFQRDIAFPLTL